MVEPVWWDEGGLWQREIPLRRWELVRRALVWLRRVDWESDEERLVRGLERVLGWLQEAQLPLEVLHGFGCACEARLLVGQEEDALRWERLALTRRWLDGAVTRGVYLQGRRMWFVQEELQGRHAAWWIALLQVSWVALGAQWEHLSRGRASGGVWSEGVDEVSVFALRDTARALQEGLLRAQEEEAQVGIRRELARQEDALRRWCARYWGARDAVRARLLVLLRLHEEGQGRKLERWREDSEEALF